MLKIVITAVLAVSLAMPAFAAEMNKGGKSYQKRSNINQSEAAQAAQSPGDVAKIAPAAGGDQPMGEQTAAPRFEEGKTLREEMRLPRKN